MRIGPFTIERVRRNAAGLEIYPWQALTEDRVAPELRQVVAKVARSEVKNFLAELREEADEQCVSSHCVENNHIYVSRAELRADAGASDETCTTGEPA